VPPARAYSDRIVSLPVVSGDAPDPLPILIAAVAPADFQIFPTTAYSAIVARTTDEAIQLIERERPHLIALDWDSDALDAKQICAVARLRVATGILVIMTAPRRAPSALKPGVMRCCCGR
jgi:CheY-like chemotaxis protein